MNTWFRKALDIRKGEWGRTGLMVFYIFLIICSYLILKPMTRSLVLKKLGPEKLPYIYMLVALVSGVVAVTYARLSARMRLNRLINTTTLFLISNLVIFWWLLNSGIKAPWLYYVLYTWVSIYGVLTVSQFWLLANYVFNPREARRIFPILAAAAIGGGITGGYLTKALVKPVGGTHNLAFFCMAFLGITMLLMNLAWRRRAQVSEAPSRKGTPEAEGQFLRIVAEIFSLIRRSRHLALLIGIVGMIVMVSQIADFQFSAFATQQIKGTDDLTAFIGFWLSNLSVISLIFQVTVAGYVIKRFGAGMATLFLPLAMLISSTWVLVGYGLASILVLKIADGAFRYSINKAGLELLFLPIPQNVKKKTKVFIDTFADRLARGISGFLLLIFYTWMGLSIAQVSLISIVLVMIWISIVLAMRKEYVNSFRKALEKREINLEDLRLNISEASTLPLLTEALKSENERQVVYALDMLSGVKDRALLPALRPLIRHSSAEVRRKALALLGNIGDGELIPEVQKRLADPDVAVRTEAIRFICAHGAAEQSEQLQQYLQDPDPLTRAAAAGYIAAHGSPSEKELIDRRLIEELLRVSDAGAETVRAHLCSVLGTLQKPEYYPYLFQMLEDPSPVVKRAAIAGAGQTRHREFIPSLLQLLGKPPFRAHARAALANFGERILGTLNDHLLDESVDFSIRRSIPRLISEIPVQRSVNVLLEALPQVPSPLKHEVLRALNRMRKRYPDLRFHPEVVLDALRAEVQEYYVARCALIHFSPDEGTSPSEAASGEPLRLFRRALQEKLDRSMERVFRLLGLLYPLRDIYSAFLGIISNNKPLRASGIEFLDNLLSRQLKTYVMPLLEQQSPEELKRRGRRLFQLDLDEPEKALSYLIQNNDPWLKACAIYVVPIIGRDRFNSLIESARNDSNPFVQEAAARALKLQE